MVALQAAECVGIDKFTGDHLAPSLRDVENLFATTRKILISGSDNSAEDIQDELRQLLSEDRWPMFYQQDIIKSDNLPHDLDLGYCKLVLGNIYNGEYGNSPMGKDAVMSAIRNITECIKKNGLFCLVEKDVMSFQPFLERANLTFLRVCHVRRGEIGAQGRLTSSTGIGNYIVYYYKRT
jgi:hypothetical protein